MKLKIIIGLIALFILSAFVLAGDYQVDENMNLLGNDLYNATNINGTAGNFDTIKIDSDILFELTSVNTSKTVYTAQSGNDNDGWVLGDTNYSYPDELRIKTKNDVGTDVNRLSIKSGTNHTIVEFLKDKGFIEMNTNFIHNGWMIWDHNDYMAIDNRYPVGTAHHGINIRTTNSTGILLQRLKIQGGDNAKVLIRNSRLDLDNNSIINAENLTDEYGYFDGLESTSQNISAYWCFDENTGSTSYDLTGSGNDITLQGNADFQDSKYMTGLKTYGATGDYGSYTDSLFNNTNNFTFLSFVKYDSLESTNLVMLQERQSVNHQASFYRKQNENKWYMAVGNGTEYEHISYTANIETDKWYCYVASFNDGEAKIYIDGILETSSSLNFTSVNTGSATYKQLGKWDVSIGTNQTLDNIKVYNRELNNKEIKEYCMFANPDYDKSELYIKRFGNNTIDGDLTVTGDIGATKFVRGSDTVLIPESANYRGSNCSGSDADANRILTLTNTRLTVDDGLGININGLLLHSADYSISHYSSGTNITLTNKVWDTDYIAVTYFT